MVSDLVCQYLDPNWTQLSNWTVDPDRFHSARHRGATRRIVQRCRASCRPPDNIGNGVAPGTSALALGHVVRLHMLLGNLIVAKLFCPQIVFAHVKGTEEVSHRCDHS